MSPVENVILTHFYKDNPKAFYFSLQNNVSQLNFIPKQVSYKSLKEKESSISEE